MRTIKFVLYQWLSDPELQVQTKLGPTAEEMAKLEDRQTEARSRFRFGLMTRHNYSSGKPARFSDFKLGE